MPKGKGGKSKWAFKSQYKDNPRRRKRSPRKAGGKAPSWVTPERRGRGLQSRKRGGERPPRYTWGMRPARWNEPTALKRGHRRRYIMGSMGRLDSQSEALSERLWADAVLMHRRSQRRR
jgi:hypothetical protein